jgi:hypothetical protein
MSMLQSRILYLKDLPESVIQEEFLRPSGAFDLVYMQSITYNRRLRFKELNDALFSCKVPMHYIPQEYNNEVFREEFLSHYTFGKFKQPREWISEIYYKTEKLLTRKALFIHLLS